MNAPSVWSYQTNDALKNARYNVKEMDGYAPTANFRQDYLAYCNILGISPHPQILPQQNKQYDFTEQDNITIRNWAIDTPTITATCLALPHSTITSLILFSTNLSKEQLLLLFKKLPNCSITQLSIEWNPLSEEEDVIFAELFQDKTNITTLSLRSNGISTHGAKAIASQLPKLKKLTTLNLFGNPFGDEGAMALCNGLLRNTSIQHISVSHTGITGKGALLFVQSITEYPPNSMLMAEVEAAEEHIEKMLEDAKTKKTKLTREGAMEQLGLPIRNGDDLYAPNEVLEYINISANAITAEDLVSMNELMIKFEPTLEKQFKRLKCHSTPRPDIELSSFIDVGC